MVLGAMGLSMLTGLGSGFAFGTGYGAGVRFGYEDVYPYLKKNLGGIAQMLNIPYASSGFKLASGVTAHQGMGLADAESASGGMGLQTPEDITPKTNPQQNIQVKTDGVKRVYFGGRDWAVLTENNRAINPFNGPTHYASYNSDDDTYDLWVKAGDRYRLYSHVDMHSDDAQQGIITPNF